MLMILVLLPFWTSLLVRTSAWKVLLQQQGVINDFLVFVGIVADDNRLELMNNVTGTVIAMTHILLPFMILPLFSVMKTIPPTYMRAAKSMGANDFTAFRRVYFHNPFQVLARVRSYVSFWRLVTTSRLKSWVVPRVCLFQTVSHTTFPVRLTGGWAPRWVRFCWWWF